MMRNIGIADVVASLILFDVYYLLLVRYSDADGNGGGYCREC